MEKFVCENCQRDFASQESLSQHNRDKHGFAAQPRQELKQSRKHGDFIEKKKPIRSKLLKRSIYIAIPVILIAAAIFISPSFISPSATTGNPIASSDIPKSPIHWHPKLAIEIKGQNQIIPANLGASGMHYPVHTHDATGVLHYEVDNP
ncbi:MAG: hypothetical protein QMD85_01225, partial [Candidatus Aenigmarchaeota archaeon]|nr:hypothetical protein [Candidatus Aenigmarchaeota archaeon]MDI6722165.1 hypothetical protein [Candidatus Aenigmarchaeota archaeon]